MASLILDGADLTLKMSELEIVEAFPGDVRDPLAAVQAVRVVDDAWPELRGIRAPSTGIPGVIAIGTRRGPFGKDLRVWARSGTGRGRGSRGRRLCSARCDHTRQRKRGS